jgi:DNA-directed RNA polymerase subunit RPC12/RpoP
MIEYQCKRCDKKFKIKEYAQLEMIYSQDNSLPTGRKCNNCGNEIKIDDKNVTI